MEPMQRMSVMLAQEARLHLQERLKQQEVLDAKEAKKQAAKEKRKNAKESK